MGGGADTDRANAFVEVRFYLYPFEYCMHCHKVQELRGDSKIKIKAVRMVARTELYAVSEGAGATRCKRTIRGFRGVPGGADEVLM